MMSKIELRVDIPCVAETLVYRASVGILVVEVLEVIDFRAWCLNNVSFTIFVCSAVIVSN